MFDDDYENTIKKVFLQQVSDALKKDPKNLAKHMEDLGFTWFSDDEDDQEEREEQSAKPDNPNQELLVAYFDGHIDLSEDLLEVFFIEKYSESPNYPLFRKYFKSGNHPLKRLILLGMEEDPTDVDLLDDLSYFSEFSNISGLLIDKYLRACDETQVESDFEQLAIDFFYNTVVFGYDAIHELTQRFDADPYKSQSIQKVIQEIDSDPEPIEF
ncbi:MAG: hypothetical protein GY866_11440 [Proteobacteria bacterium]|nr:hypothetical protein [Pseudomonadota bacterium]